MLGTITSIAKAPAVGYYYFIIWVFIAFSQLFIIKHMCNMQHILGVITYKSDLLYIWTLQIQQPFLVNKFEVPEHMKNNWALRNTETQGQIANFAILLLAGIQSLCLGFITCKVGMTSTPQDCEDQMTQLSNQHHCLVHSRHSINFVFLSLLPTR